MSIRRVTVGVVMVGLLAWLVVSVRGLLTSVPTGVATSPSEGSSSEPAGPAGGAPGIRVRGSRLVEANGRDLVLRGINHAYLWYQAEERSFADIKATGANSIRISLASGQRWPANSATDVADVVSECRKNRLICVLDVHDTMGLGQQEGAATMTQAVDYWLSVQSALAGQESYVIVNIANEPYGNNNFKTWAADTTAAIQRLRAAGFRHALMVDAPDWGQDDSFTMRDNARAVFAADPERNTVFSVHMYGIFNTAAKVRSYMASFIRHGLSLVVGEFGDMHRYGDPDEDAIMAYAWAGRIGYLGWSWSGNTNGVEYLDMVNNFDPASRTPWGRRFITGPNGLSTTAREASVFGVGAKRQ